MENKLVRMHNVGIVVESLDDAISFFSELGLKLEGRMNVEGEWAGRVTGLGSQRVEIDDGYSRWPQPFRTVEIHKPSNGGR